MREVSGSDSKLWGLSLGPTGLLRVRSDQKNGPTAAAVGPVKCRLSDVSYRELDCRFAVGGVRDPT